MRSLPGFLLTLILLFSAVGSHATRVHDIRLDRFFGGPLAVTGSVYEIRGELAYIGSGTFSSVYMHYRVNDEEVHTTHFADIGINPQIPFYYVAGEPWVPENEGRHQLTVWFSGLNGAPVEEGASDTLMIPVDVYEYLPPRELSLIESFSSINCGSCAIINPVVRNMIDKNSDRYTMVFYHPMAHENSPLYNYNPKDQDIRRQHYGVSYTPFAVVGSLYRGGTEYVNEAMLDMEREKPGGFTISGSYNIYGNDLNVHVDTESYASFAGRRIHLYVVLKESVVEFDSPPGSNNESTFYYVMRSFIPDAGGIPLEHQEPGTVYSGELTYTLNPEILDFSQLTVIAFIQDTVTGDVFQTVRLDDEAGNGDNGDNDNGDGDDEDDDGNGDNGDDDNGDDDNGDDDNGDDDNGDDDNGDDDGEETSVHDATEQRAFRIYPNPTGGILNISSGTSAAINALRVYDLQGRVVFSFVPGTSGNTGATIDLSHLPAGMYLLRLDTPDGPSFKNILIHR